jgi:hypothetical protein
MTIRVGLKIVGQRVAARGAQQIDGRIAGMARTERFELLGDTIQRFPFLAIPVLSFDAHVFIGFP